MSKKILIFGGTGLIGKPVVEHLAKEGFEIKLFVRTPEKAEEMFGTCYEIFVGDLQNKESIKNAMKGCSGVHVSLKGGPTPESYELAEHKGTSNIVAVATELGIEKLTYLSGATVDSKNRHFYMINAKYNAEEIIKNSGVPYVIFRATTFMESIPLFVQNGRASMIGKQRYPMHLIAATDFAKMVSKVYNSSEIVNQSLNVFGEEAIDLMDALERFCKVSFPKLKVGRVPIWLISIIAYFTRDRNLKDTIRFMAYLDKTEEGKELKLATDVLGISPLSYQQWCEVQT
ncbi:MAG: NAD(P)H-binding protein [Proteobacteria bacterium]|nr:NAD(P)H-binding protein [Pseudomonadota bacterium]